MVFVYLFYLELALETCKVKFLKADKDKMRKLGRERERERKEHLTKECSSYRGTGEIIRTDEDGGTAKNFIRSGEELLREITRNDKHFIYPGCRSGFNYTELCVQLFLCPTIPVTNYCDTGPT